MPLPAVIAIVAGLAAADFAQVSVEHAALAETRLQRHDLLDAYFAEVVTEYRHLPAYVY